MRTATFAWALAAALLTAGPASPQDTGLRTTVESRSIDGSLGGSDVAQGITGPAGSAISAVQRDATGVLAGPDAAQTFAPSEAPIASVDPTTLIGLPLVTNDAAVIGKIQAVQIGPAGEPQAVIAILSTVTGSQEIRLPIELTALQHDGVQVEASEVDVRAFFAAEAPPAGGAAAATGAFITTSLPGLAGQGVAAQIEDSPLAIDVARAASSTQLPEPAQASADATSPLVGGADAALAHTLMSARALSTDSPGSTNVASSLPRSVPEKAVTTDVVEVASTTSVTAAELAGFIAAPESSSQPTTASANKPRGLFLYGLLVSLLVGMAGFAAWRWRRSLTGQVLAFSRRQFASSRPTRKLTAAAAGLR